MANSKEIKLVEQSFEKALLKFENKNFNIDFDGEIRDVKIDNFTKNNFINRLVNDFENKRIDIEKDTHLKFDGVGALEIFVKNDCSLFFENLNSTFVYVKIIVENNAKINFVDLTKSSNSWKFIDFDLNENSSLYNSQILLDSNALVTMAYLKKSSIYRLNSAHYLDNGRSYIYNGAIHLSEKTNSDLLMRGAIINGARVICDGLVRIDHNAPNSEGYQTINGLLLDDKSMILSEPILEIENNNVKCSHGCSIYQIKDEHLYYMQARGISREDSIKLIVEGFFNDVLDNVKNKEFNNILSELIVY